MPIINKFFIRFVCLTIVLLSAGSCRDEIDIPGGEIPEGWARVTLNVDFTQFMPTRLGSRSAGDSFDEMRKLWVLVYDKSGTELLKTKEMSSKIETGGQKAEDTMELPFGEYQIYAVANVDDILTTYADEIKTANGLKNIRLEWIETAEGLGRNDQMMGYFTVNGSSSAVMSDNPVIRIDKRETTIESKVIRAASKVTVAYDGSDLKDGVKIYIKSLRIKNIPRTCLLGSENTVKSKEDLIENGEEIVYSTSTSYDDNFPGLISNEKPYFPRRTSADSEGEPVYGESEDPHSHTSDGSLFFYENLQGEGPDKQQKDENSDGVLDELYGFNEKPYATYIEVEAYYDSKNPERPGVDNIIYRFMLGGDIEKNYDARRNHHYKLTLHFNGFANEPDWRIDHVRFFAVDQPHDVNYKGEYFVPDPKINNLGDDFRPDNYIVIKSFEYPKENNRNDYIPVNYKIVEYKDFIDGEFKTVTGLPAWLDIDWDTDLAEEKDKNRGIHKFKIEYKNPYTEVDLDEKLGKTKAITKDLSLVDAKMNTANSYIVSSKGTYTIPLVYGNAIVNGSDNKSAYSGFGTGERVLGTFQNYLGQPIKSPYILDDAREYASTQAIGTISTELVWEDVEGLIDLSSIKYVSSLYSDKGGIQFTISSGIKQGNAVIAIKNGDKIMWSWHIWVTAFDFDRLVTFTNHAGDGMTVMPVNLGWCSNGEKVRYYDRHVCKIRFEQDRIGEGGDTYSQEITIVQEPHITLPMGDNPYYQWGRKDPFPGADIVLKGGVSKQWWYQNGTALTEWNRWDGSDNHFAGYRTLNKYKNLTAEDKNDKRKKTIDILGDLIQKPNYFNNPKFKGFKPTIPEIKDDDGNVTQEGQAGATGENDDETYTNLWTENLKTVYDPSPFGYRVNPLNTFTGLTYNGDNITVGEEDGDVTDWFSVIENNMQDGYKFENGLFEFYTNKNKLESLPFPLTGYIDYDQVVIIFLSQHGYIWEATNINSMSSNFFKYIPDKDGFWNEWNRPTIAPLSGYYATDGCSVRPLKMETSSTTTTPESHRRR